MSASQTCIPLLFMVALAPLAPAQAKKAAEPAAKPAAAQAPTSYREHKLAAIETWLGANKSSADREEALPEAAALAADLSKWDKSRSFAESYLKDFGKGGKSLEMQIAVVKAWCNLPGHEKDAKAAFEKAMAGAGEDVNAVVTVSMEAADAMFYGSGDKEFATKVLEGLGERFPQIQQLQGMTKAKIAEYEQIGKDPKEIDVTGLDGKPIKLADYKGKVTLLDFWATWCGPCLQELPNVVADYKKFHAKGFEIIGISLDRQGDEQKLKDFVASHEMTWPQYFDGKWWKNEVAVAYGVQSIPATYLLDREGKVHRIGLRGPALGAEIEKLLSAKAAAPAPAKSDKGK